MICPECEGKGENLFNGHLNMGRRDELDLTMREAAKINGWDLMVQNDLEWGRMPTITRTEKRLWEKH